MTIKTKKRIVIIEKIIAVLIPIITFTTVFVIRISETKTAKITLASPAAQRFNAQFASYERKISGSNVKALLSVISTSNQTNLDRTVAVYTKASPN